MPDAADLHSRRQGYEGTPLVEADVDPDPFVQFDRWYRAAASEPGVVEPNAMVLASVDAHGRPSQRNVLLRGVRDGAFVFYTNLGSQKARELVANPQASLLVSWLALSRQVRIEGTAAVVPDDEADDYFASRPRGSQLGAWASDQSEVVPSRANLEAQFAEVEARYAGIAVPRPPHWSGFAVTAHEIEFWQGRADRLHDRLRYRNPAPVAPAGAATNEPSAGSEAAWVIERLSP